MGEKKRDRVLHQMYPYALNTRSSVRPVLGDSEADPTRDGWLVFLAITTASVKLKKAYLVPGTA